MGTNAGVRSKTKRKPLTLEKRTMIQTQLAVGYRAEACIDVLTACMVKLRIELRLQPGAALWGHAAGYLKAGYSSAQIAGTPAGMYPDNPLLQVSHETTLLSMPCRATSCAQK